MCDVSMGREGGRSHGRAAACTPLRAGQLSGSTGEGFHLRHTPTAPSPLLPYQKQPPGVRHPSPLSQRWISTRETLPTQQPQPPGPTWALPSLPASLRPGRRRWPSPMFPHRGSSNRFAKKPGGKAPAGPAAEETFAFPPGSQGAKQAGRSPSRAFCWVSVLGRKALVFPTLSDTF